MTFSWRSHLPGHAKSRLTLHECALLTRTEHRPNETKIDHGRYHSGVSAALHNTRTRCERIFGRKRTENKSRHTLVIVHKMAFGMFYFIFLLLADSEGVRILCGLWQPDTRCRAGCRFTFQTAA